MILISFYGSLAGLPQSRYWNGARENMKMTITSSGITREQLWPSDNVGC
jgi:hypothetical protein